MRIRWGETAAFFASVLLLVGFALSQAADAQEKRKLLRAPTSAETGETSKVSQINNWTIGLAGGLPEGTFIRFAAEIARNLNDPAELRVLPVITQGATDNVKDLLYLKGIDVAITNADVLDYFKNQERIPNIEKRINFISEMVISEVHLVVRHRDVLLFALGVDKAQIDEFYALISNELQNIRCGRHRFSLNNWFS